MAAPLVAHIIYALKTGGLENGLVNIINRSSDYHYRHCIICITDADDFAQRITRDDVDIYQLKKRPGRDFAFYIRLMRLLRSLRPAIIHTRNFTALDCQLVSLTVPQAKRIHGEHGRSTDDPDGLNPKFLGIRKLLRPLIHHYIAVSKDIEGWLLKYVKAKPSRVTQIYNGVDTDLFAPSTDGAETPAAWNIEPRVIIGTVGRLDPVKNHRGLLRAFARMIQASPDLAQRCRLSIIGDGPERTALEQTIAQLNLQDHVWMTGDRKDVSALLATMDIFVLPSLAEGISNTLLEAQASGLPVIASSVGGNLELVDHEANGLLVAPEDVPDLALALETLVRQPSKRKLYGSAGCERIRSRFAWDATVSAYLSVYDKLLQAKPVGLEK